MFKTFLSAEPTIVKDDEYLSLQHRLLLARKKIEALEALEAQLKKKKSKNRNQKAEIKVPKKRQ